MDWNLLRDQLYVILILELGFVYTANIVFSTLLPFFLEVIVANFYYNVRNVNILRFSQCNVQQIDNATVLEQRISVLNGKIDKSFSSPSYVPSGV